MPKVRVGVGVGVGPMEFKLMTQTVRNKSFFFLNRSVLAVSNRNVFGWRNYSLFQDRFYQVTSNGGTSSQVPLFYGKN